MKIGTYLGSTSERCLSLVRNKLSKDNFTLVKWCNRFLRNIKWNSFWLYQTNPIKEYCLDPLELINFNMLVILYA